MEACLYKIFGSVAGSVVGKVAEYTVDPIVRQFGFLFNHRSKLENLRDQVQKLKDEQKQVQQSVEEASRNAEVIFDKVNRWLYEVNGKISEASTQLEVDEEKANQRCFVGGLCPNFKSRYQLSNKADKEANAIAQLLEKANQLGPVAHRSDPEGIAPARPVKDYESFESRSGAFDAIMAALKDTSLSIFGVYGMGGVGKTTLVKQVAKQAKDENLFDAVVMAAIPHEFDIGKTQVTLAEQLGLNFKNQSDSGRAHQLRQRLMKKRGEEEQKKHKGVLIILDDIWETLDLEAIGIPSPGVKYEECKILMTSRELKVLSLMDSQKDIPIEVLAEEEAWNLFKKMAGDIVLRPDLTSTAFEVAKKCAGLPVAIVAVAKAMRIAKKSAQWKDALRKLKPSESNFKGISASAYAAIELSYNHLEDKEHRVTFLLCSIMGHDAAIEDLLKYGMGLDLFHGVNTLEETRNRVVTLVSSLKNSSLLLDASKPNCFDMHDVVRDVAISIASRDHHWLALFGNDDVFNGWSDEAMKNCELISLQKFAKVGEVIHDREMECPNLTFFFMGGDEKDTSLKIPNNFFNGMQRLKVLGFVEMPFSSLPSSISLLKSTLCTLRLSDCVLEHIAIIGELINLEILDLRRSKGKMLPKEIGKLSKLKLLNLSDCYYLTKIPRNVLSRLSSLEELYLYDSFDGWEVDEERDDNNASLVELQSLSHLATLEVHISDEQAIPKDSTFFGTLERYKISIGRNSRWSWDAHKVETSRMLQLTRMDQSIHLYLGVKMLLMKADTVSLEGVEDVVVDMANDIRHLKHFRVSDVSEIRYVVNSMKSGGFPLLESLSLEHLENLETICCGQLQAGSFGHLRVIKVDSCPKMKNLFSFSIVMELHQLQEIEVSECWNMTELILLENKDVSGINLMKSGGFPLLESLSVDNLKNLETIWYGQFHAGSFHHLRVIKVERCNELKNLFSFSIAIELHHLQEINVTECRNMTELILLEKKGEEDFSGEQMHSSSQGEIGVQSINAKSNAKPLDEKVLFPSLKELRLQSVAFEKLWPHRHHQLCSLKELNVYHCDNLKHLFSSSMVKGFLHLRTLVVEYCYKMEEVITVNEGLTDEKRTAILVFPKLQELRLWGLSNLKRFCSGNNLIKFPVLREVSIQSCHVLRAFSTETRESRISKKNENDDVPEHLFNEKVALPKLEVLHIDDMESLERIWPNQLADEESFSKLSHLHLDTCWKLRNVFPLSMLTRLQSLTLLRIENCDSMEEMTSEPQQLQGGAAIQSLSLQPIEFPQLKELKLWELPNLKSFSPTRRTIMWPSLERMELSGCGKVEILFFPEKADGRSQQEIPIIPQPLFWVNKLTFPKLEHLTLGWNDGWNDGTKEIWHVHSQPLASQYFCSLKAVLLEDFPKELDILPSGRLFQFLISLPYLERLEINWAYFKEMFQGKWVSLLSQLTELQLSDLHDLRNLVKLKVDGCDGIIKLATHHIIKSLVQLQEMKISYCKKMEEIIKGSGHDKDGDVKVEINFGSLKLLELHDLPSLESFCSSENCIFHFPSLKIVIVRDCPKMKMFSQGDSYTPMLCKVKFFKWSNVEHWFGSLNRTIQEIIFRGDPQLLPKLQSEKEDQGNPSTSKAQEFMEDDEDDDNSEIEDDEEDDEL